MKKGTVKTLYKNTNKNIITWKIKNLVIVKNLIALKNTVNVIRKVNLAMIYANAKDVWTVFKINKIYLLVYYKRSHKIKIL